MEDSSKGIIIELYQTVFHLKLTGNENIQNIGVKSFLFLRKSSYTI